MKSTTSRRAVRRRAKLRAGAAGLCVAVLATACGTAPTEEAAAPVDNAEAAAVEEAEAAGGGAGLPTLVADTVGGAQIDTNSLEGQDVVVWFWAPW